MPIVEIGDRHCFVRLELSPAEVPGLLARHASNYPGATAVEQLGAGLKAADFAPSEALKYLQSVLVWGRGHRLARRLERVSGDEVSAALAAGCRLATAGEVAKGVVRICELHGLGISFASKLLRFLEPTRAVILDSVIRSGIGYPESSAGYTEFLSDCEAVLDAVRGSALLPQSESHRLRVCDIEAAVFAKIQGY